MGTIAEGPDLRNLVSVPLFHVTGCNSQLLVQLAIGGTTVVLPTVVLPPFEVQAFLRTIVDERINVLTSVPAIYALALAQPDLAEFDPRSTPTGSSMSTSGWPTSRSRSTSRCAPNRCPATRAVRSSRVYRPWLSERVGALDDDTLDRLAGTLRAALEL